MRDKLGELVFAADKQTLAEVVGKKLVEQKKTVAVAESCTGGTLSKFLTDIPGASSYFTCGWISYSNNAKITELGVPAELIGKFGAVSKEVSEAMAQKARGKAKADYAISITGIAGPTGATEQKPVGLVYITLAWDTSYQTERYVFSGDRRNIRLTAANTALNILRLRLNN